MEPDSSTGPAQDPPTSAPESPRRLWPRLVLGTLILAIGGTLLTTLEPPTAEEVRALANSRGIWGFLLAIPIVTAIIVFPVPASIPTVIVGFAFDFTQGLIIMLIASLLAGILTFYFGRWLGPGLFASSSRQRIRAIDGYLAANGFSAAFILRALPFVPFWIVGYVAGMASIRFSHYLFGTALGIIPGAVIFTAAGAFGAQPNSPQFRLSLVALVALIVVTSALTKYLRKRGQIPAEL